MPTLEEIAASLRSRQAQMQKEYDCRTPIGQPLEIPWPGHLPVKVLVNLPKKSCEGTMDQEKGKGGTPFYINAHGGGFIEGDAFTMGTHCQKLADRLGIPVFNLNYRLAPDYPYPYPGEEAKVLLDYIEAHAIEYGIDPQRGGMGGFSAGAMLTLIRAISDIKDPDRKLKLKAIMLGYPGTSSDLADSDAESPFQAMDETMAKAISLFYNGHEKDDELSPLYAPDEVLKKFPDTILFTCGNDSLGPQGVAFGARLVQNGVTVLFRRYAQAFHGFVEVNRPDYFPEDTRKTPEQQALSDDAEEFIIQGLKMLL